MSKYPDNLHERVPCDTTSESAKPDGHLVTRYEGSKAVEILYKGTVPLDEHYKGRPVWFSAPIAQTADARDTERLDWFLLDCDFDGINGFDVREMAYEAVPHSATESEYNAAYLAACRKAIYAAIAAIQREGEK